MSGADDPTSIGNILVQLGFCSKEQIEKAVEKFEAQRMCDILIDLGFCSKEQVEKAMERFEAQRMGEVLISMNVIDTDQLNYALQFQRMKRMQMTPQEELEFAENLRSTLITELFELRSNILSFAAKVNNN